MISLVDKTVLAHGIYLPGKVNHKTKRPGAEGLQETLTGEARRVKMKEHTTLGVLKHNIPVLLADKVTA